MPNRVEKYLSDLAHGDAKQRQNAACLLGRDGIRPAVPNLIEALGDEAFEVQEAAAWSLGKIGAVEAIPALIDRLYDKSFATRSSVGWALVNIGEPARESVTEVYQSDRGEAGQMALMVLDRMAGFSAVDAYRLESAYIVDGDSEKVLRSGRRVLKGRKGPLFLSLPTPSIQ